MGKKDIVTKKYMEDNEVFADAFNYLIYGGEQVIQADKLRSLDTTAAEVPYGIKALSPVQKIRDELKFITAKTDDKIAYLILGIENQSEIHYAMPVKNMVYDALEYGNQVSKTAAKHKKSGDAATKGEYLSGFRKGDRLTPVVTVVIYFGADKWDAPLSIHEMLSETDERVISFVEDYKIHLIAPADLSEEDFDKFRTNLREVMAYIKYSNDKDKLKNLVETNEEFSHMDVQAAMVLNACTKSELKIDQTEGVIDMCEAIKGIREDGRTEGRAEGRAEGRTEGRIDGRIEGLLRSIKSIMETLNLTAEQAMDALKIPEEERAAYLAKM